jgi:hypothetical protein
MADADAGKQQKDKQLTDPFWLRTVFPDPVEVFGFNAPPVSTLFADAIFGLDANALLAPYQVSKQSADEIERIYREFTNHDRLFVPDQAAREFGKNRGLKLAEMHDEVHKLTSALTKAEPIDCPMLEGVPAYEELFPLVESIRESIKKYKDLVGSLKQTLSEWGWTDRVSTLYRELFTKARIIGHDIKDDDFMKKLAWRYAHQVPPGYKDKAKADSGIGDLAIWYSLLRLGRDRKRHVIFVCNETKHDWVYRSGDQTLTPRMELCLEFHRTTGAHFGLVNWPRFLELAGAEEVTVRDAASAERWASKHSYALMPVVARVKQILEDINEIVEVGPEAEGSSYAYLHGYGLASLIDAFVEAKTLYEALVRPPTGLDYLNEVQRVLRDIRELNRGIAYDEARMKRSADAETARLKQKCKEFGKYYRLFRKATIPLS